MRKRIIWGLATLIVLLLGVSAFLLLQRTDTVPTEPMPIVKDIEPSKDNPPPAEQGYIWVWHHNHWDKVKIAEVNQPIEHQDGQIVDTEDVPTSEKTDLSKYEGKDNQEDFYRDLFSREELESMLKADQRDVERILTEFIPRTEASRNRLLEHLQSRPNNEYAKELLAEVEAQLNQYKFEVNNLEEMIASKLIVLNEEANNVEE